MGNEGSARYCKASDCATPISCITEASFLSVTAAPSTTSNECAKRAACYFLASPIIDFALMSNAHRQALPAARSRLPYVTRLLQEVTDAAELVNSSACAHELDNLR
jgi:hypothetical protein